MRFIAPLIIMTLAFVGVGTAIVLAPQSQPIQVHASTGEVVTAEYTVTFKTIDGEIIAEVETVDALIPIDRIPNAPQIDHRPFLRWTNVQGFSLNGIITQDVTFLPLYSYDPQFEVENGEQDKDEGVKKTHWTFMNYVLDETAIALGVGVLIVGGLFLLFVIRRILK